MRGTNLPSASHREIVNKEAFEQLAAEAGLTDEPSSLSEQTVGTPTTLELETEKIYQRARPLPMFRHWLTRCFAVAVVSLATPYVAGLLHPPGSSEEHGEDTEAKDVRHAEGRHDEGSPVADMQWSLLLLLVPVEPRLFVLLQPVQDGARDTERLRLRPRLEQRTQGDGVRARVHPHPCHLHALEERGRARLLRVGVGLRAQGLS